MQLIERLRLGGPNAAEVAGEAADEIERLLKHHPNPADYRYWEGRYRDEAAENERLRARIDELEKIAVSWRNVACVTPTQSTTA